MTAWAYVIAFSIFAWAALTAGSIIKGGAASAALNWIFGVLTVACAIIAGSWAKQTVLYSLVSWVVHLHPVIGLLVFALTLVALIGTIPALMIDRVSALTVTPAIAAAWIFLPSLVSAGAIPGSGGAAIGDAIGSVSSTLVEAARWFG